MESVNNILKKACDKLGFKRTRYLEKNVPTSMSNISVLLFLGDLRATTAVSYLLLKRLREELKSSKYFIVCGWPGQEGLFPYIDEYWEIADLNLAKLIYNKTNFTDNLSEHTAGYLRILHNFFEDVLDFDWIKPFYDCGFKKEYFDKFNHIKRYLPTIPSSMILGNEFNRYLLEHQGKKVFITPSLYMEEWSHGRINHTFVSKDFWLHLISKFLDKNYSCIVQNNYMTHDLSPDLLNKVLFFTDNNVLNIMSAMRSTNCVIDVFTGTSKLAIGARTPFLGVNERSFYSNIKEYEIEDLAGQDIPREYVFSFPSICSDSNKTHWNSSISEVIIAKVNKLLDRVAEHGVLPTPNELYETVTYATVRKFRDKKMGTKFIKVPKY